MELVKKYKYAILVVALAVGVLALVISIPTPGQAEITFERPADVSISLQDNETLVRLFKDNSIIDVDHVTNVKIMIVPDIADPMFVQSDKDGNMVISSRFDIDEKSKTVAVSIVMGEFVMGQDPAQQVKWLESEFLKNANIIAKRNLKTDRGDIPKLNIFTESN